MYLVKSSLLRHLVGLLLLGVVMTGALPAAARGALELVMIEQHGCHWCEAWNEAVGPVYPKTPEGAAAPLRRIQLRDPVPGDLSFASKPVFTPTFILVEDGTEIGRIEGYPGEDMFWWMVTRMFTDAGLKPPSAPDGP